ncbi:hypothetical protein EV675_0281 [Pigmentiphaga kullae]|uniref:Uncharacterized protein n=1 Tax=Pigmentiphaga kullae TaxID=151784 RepID=A0A4V2F3I9_9BURK|nr:hypothetical protein EV675_0281 [Pigmentiphaga kullae]
MHRGIRATERPGRLFSDRHGKAPDSVEVFFGQRCSVTGQDDGTDWRLLMRGPDRGCDAVDLGEGSATSDGIQPLADKCEVISNRCGSFVRVSGCAGFPENRLGVDVVQESKDGAPGCGTVHRDAPSGLRGIGPALLAFNFVEINDGGRNGPSQIRRQSGRLRRVSKNRMHEPRRLMLGNDLGTKFPNTQRSPVLGRPHNLLEIPSARQRLECSLHRALVHVEFPRQLRNTSRLLRFNNGFQNQQASTKGGIQFTSPESGS